MAQGNCVHCMRCSRIRGNFSLYLEQTGLGNRVRKRIVHISEPFTVGGFTV